jgi:two-component system phosphate regulon sensor histidine kinase PhoR
MWLLKVADQGLGIPKEHLGRIFERFHRVPTGNRHDVKGFGLGLHYVRTIVEAHGGRVQCASESGNGSAFTVELPNNRHE